MTVDGARHMTEERATCGRQFLVDTHELLSKVCNRSMNDWCSFDVGRLGEKLTFRDIMRVVWLVLIRGDEILELDSSL